MLKKDLIARNPLRILENTGNTVLNAGQFGMVAAMAGVGKTACWCSWPWIAFSMVKMSYISVLINLSKR